MHQVVRSGTWLYDDAVNQPVYIVMLDYDFWYEITKADGLLKAGEVPHLNEAGTQFYVCFRAVPETPPIWVDSPGFDEMEQACECAQSKVPSPISWEA